MRWQQHAHLYDAYYYAHDCGLPYQRDRHWLGFFDAIAAQIATGIGPHTVLDAGCAMGFLVEALRKRGVECYGIDVSEYAIAQVHADVRPFCQVGSICDPLQQKYDLITCIEILEHLPASDAQKAIANLCQYTNDILFSSTPSDYREVTHFNVQPPEHWAELFAGQGFFRDVDYDAAFLLPWAVRFRRRADPLPRLVREYERRFWLLWKENVDLRASSEETRSQMVEGEQAKKTAAEADELRAEAEWLRAQIRQHRRRRWVSAIGMGWRALNSRRFLGKRLIRRLPSLVEQPIHQTFTAEYDNLCAVSVLIESPPGPMLSPLHITLAHADSSEVPLVARTVSPRHLPSMGAFTLCFPPAAGSTGQSYVLTLEASEASPGDTLYLWHYPRAARPGGVLTCGDQPLASELVMSASYGIPPDTFPDRWQPPLWTAASVLDFGALLEMVIGAWRNE